MSENEISYKVVETAVELHKALGPGLLESVYEEALLYDLAELGLEVQQQVAIPFEYKGLIFDRGFRLDLLVERKVIIELKSVEFLAPIHYAQTLTYLKLSGLKLALLINFNTRVLKEGVHRIVNGL